jgi:serine/threonine protein kinase
MGIVHNDICPENIYIHQDGNIRISGFHASQFIRRGKSLSRSETETVFLSRIEYSAPEVWVYNAYGLANYDEAVDYWSLGMTIFTLVTGSVSTIRILLFDYKRS